MLVALTLLIQKKSRQLGQLFKWGLYSLMFIMMILVVADYFTSSDMTSAEENAHSKELKDITAQPLASQNESSQFFYFTVFTAWFDGQTLGKKLFRIRVVQLDGTGLSLWDAFGRYGGYGAGFATGLLVFLQIYGDANRQAIQDKISATVVIDLHKLTPEQASANETKIVVAD